MPIAYTNFHVLNRYYLYYYLLDTSWKDEKLVHARTNDRTSCFITLSLCTRYMLKDVCTKGFSKECTKYALNKLLAEWCSHRGHLQKGYTGCNWQMYYWPTGWKVTRLSCSSRIGTNTRTCSFWMSGSSCSRCVWRQFWQHFVNLSAIVSTSAGLTVVSIMWGGFWLFWSVDVFFGGFKHYIRLYSILTRLTILSVLFLIGMCGQPISPTLTTKSSETLLLWAIFSKDPIPFCSWKRHICEVNFLPRVQSVEVPKKRVFASKCSTTVTAYYTSHYLPFVVNLN